MEKYSREEKPRGKLKGFRETERILERAREGGERRGSIEENKRRERRGGM